MNFAALLTYVFVSAYTPGPNNIMAVTNSARYGFSKTMPFCFGTLFGFFFIMTVCAVATSFLYEQIPVIEPVMRWIGAAYIAYLAVVVYRDQGGENSGESSTPAVGLATGAVMQLVNVKVILYGITAISTFVLPHYRSVGALAVAVFFLSVIGFSGTMCWALFGSLFQNFHAAHRKLVNSIMALLLIYCAAGILV